MTNKDILNFIVRYAADERKLGRGRNERVFFKRSNTIWACKEMYSQIKSNPQVPAKKTIERFAATMEEYACRANKKFASAYAFSIASDTANDILDSIDIYERIKL